MFDGVLNLSIWGYVVAILLTTHITIASVTIYLHRSQAHRAVELHPVVGHFFRFWLWLTTGMVTKEWIAVHRKHHANSDRPDDPHSPLQFGIGKVLLQGAELYGIEAKKPETLAKYGHGAPQDWIERHLYSRHTRTGLALLLGIYLVLYGLAGVALWGVQMIWIPFWAAGVINGVGHYRGYRNYETADTSTNIVPWGLVIGGEELHNNHHAFPSSARFSSRWWEFDVGWCYLQLLQRVGLVRIKKVAPRPIIVPYKRIADMETLRAVIVSRFYVSAHYARAVIAPVIREELAAADASWRRLLKRSRKILVRNEFLIDETARHRLEQVLDRSNALRTVHQFREQLLQLWGRTTTSHEQLLQSLQDWCRRAESTGINALAEFARTLPGYRLQPAR